MTGCSCRSSQNTTATRQTTVMTANVTMKWDAEPVFLLAFVEHHLERAETEGQQAETHVIDLEAVAEAPAHQVRRIEDQRRGEQQRASIPIGILMKKIQRQL